MASNPTKYAIGREEIDGRLDEVDYLITRYLSKRSLPQGEYEDIKQQCFLKVLSRTYDASRAKLSTFVYLVCRTVINHYYRDRGAGKRVGLPDDVFKFNTDIKLDEDNTLEKQLAKCLIDDLVDELGVDGMQILVHAVDNHDGDTSKITPIEAFEGYKVNTKRLNQIRQLIKDKGL